MADRNRLLEALSPAGEWNQIHAPGWKDHHRLEGLSENRDYLKWSWSDTGWVFPRKIAENFRPFLPGAENGGREHKGTGLGLSITRKSWRDTRAPFTPRAGRGVVPPSSSAPAVRGESIFNLMILPMLDEAEGIRFPFRSFKWVLESENKRESVFSPED